MPLLNYAEPINFCDAVDAAAIILQACLTRLRDEAQHCDADDHAALHAAQFFRNMLEDTLKEATGLSAELEKRLMGTRRG